MGSEERYRAFAGENATVQAGDRDYQSRLFETARLWEESAHRVEQLATVH
jgi:hypothetical protein